MKEAGLKAYPFCEQMAEKIDGFSHVMCRYEENFAIYTEENIAHMGIVFIK